MVERDVAKKVAKKVAPSIWAEDFFGDYMDPGEEIT